MVKRITITAVMQNQDVAPECTTSLRFAATTQMSVKWHWRGFQIWSAKFSLKTIFVCAAWGSAWVKCGWVQLVSEEQTELRGTLKSVPSSTICSISELKTQKGLCLKRLLKADDSSVFHIILFPRTDVSPFSAGWSKRVPAEGVRADGQLCFLNATEWE